MIEDAEVTFTNGNTVAVERVKFEAGGWIGLRCDGDEWVYYPDRHISRVVAE